MKFKPEYRRRLPHFQPENAVLFVTFRLAGSIPKNVISQNKFKENYFSIIEETLDQAGTGNDWLKTKDLAKIVAESLHFIDERDCKIVCYCIMSNHVHFIAYKLKKPLYVIMNSIKTHTAKQCNALLNRKGRFWQREYYDHLISNRDELDFYIKYILNNPVKIGLVKKWKDWEFTYCNSAFLENN